MATLKRAYCASVDGVASADTHGAGSISVAGDSRESMLRAVNAAVPELLRGVAAGARARREREEKRKGKIFSLKKMLVKARCFPRWAAPATHAALEPSAEDARWFEPIAKHATHVLDVVCHRNRATLTLWPAEAVEAPAKRGGEDDAEARENAERDAPLSSDWKRVSDVVHDVVQDELARTPDSTVLPYPTLPPPHVATLEYLIAQHCERVGGARF